MFIAVDAAVHIGRDVEDVAVIFVVERRGARADRIRQRQIDRTATAIFHAVGEIDAALGIAADAAARTLRHDVDHTGTRILAEQRALRAAQDFEPVDIDQIGERLGGAAQHDAIEHGRYGRLNRDREGGGADAAQEQRLIERGAGLHEVERGDEILRTLEAGTALRGNRVARHDGNGERHVLQPLRTLLRGNDNVAGVRVVDGGFGGYRRGCRGLRESGCGGKQCERRGARQKYGLCHNPLLKI